MDVFLWGGQALSCGRFGHMAGSGWLCFPGSHRARSGHKLYRSRYVAVFVTVRNKGRVTALCTVYYMEWYGAERITYAHESLSCKQRIFGLVLARSAIVQQIPQSIIKTEVLLAQNVVLA